MKLIHAGLTAVALMMVLQFEVYAQLAAVDNGSLRQCIKLNLKGPYDQSHSVAYNHCPRERNEWLSACARRKSPQGFDAIAHHECEYELRTLTNAMDAQHKKERISAGRLTPSEQRERQAEVDRSAARAGNPNIETVTAKQGIPWVAGALICPDYETVSYMIERSKESFQDSLQERIYTPEQTSLIRGRSPSAPDYKRYGCALVPPESLLIYERGNTVPVVRARLPDGSTIRGVTAPSMIRQ